MEEGRHHRSWIRAGLDDRSGVVEEQECGRRVARGLGGHAECHLGVGDLHRSAALVGDLDHALQLHPGLFGPSGSGT